MESWESFTPVGAVILLGDIHSPARFVGCRRSPSDTSVAGQQGNFDIPPRRSFTIELRSSAYDGVLQETLRKLESECGEETADEPSEGLSPQSKE